MTAGRRNRISREHLLDSVVRCLVEHGYAGASTLRIQQLAGVSRGGLLHHFPSRDELLVAAVAHLAEHQVLALHEESRVLITAAPDDPARVEQAIAQMWRHFQQPYFWAAQELWLAARHNDRLRTALRPAEHALNRVVLAAVAEMFGPVLAAAPRYRATTNLLISSMRGVALTYGFAPRRPAADPHLAEWVELAHAMLTG